MSQFLALWPDPGPVFNTGAAECMRQHLGDALDFLADFHTLSKIKVGVVLLIIILNIYSFLSIKWC